MAPEPADLLGAWQRVLRELTNAAGTGSTEAARAVTALVSRQGELLQDVLERQAGLEQELRGRVLAPVTAAVDLLEQTAGAMRTQAKALEAASVAFHQASETLDVQATLLERTVQTLRDPVATIRSAGASVTRRSPPPGEGDAGHPPQP